VTVGGIYELALVEWGVTPEYINENWTEEELVVLFNARNRRLEAMLAKSKPQGEGKRMVSDRELFRRAGVQVQQVQVKQGIKRKKEEGKQ
jgi:hypothetical protein